MHQRFMPVRRSQRKNPPQKSHFRGAIALGLVSVVTLLWVAYGVYSKNREPSNTRTPVVQAPDSSQPGQAVSVDKNAALQQLLDKIVRKKGDYAVAVVELKGRAANTDGDKQYVAASTYKLFIAYAVFQQINSGSMHWADPISSGYDAKKCLEVMIVESNNSCTYAFGNKIGWQTIDDMMDKLGLHDTQVRYFNNTTTANDLALYLTKLQKGTLLNPGDTQRLLGYMKRQQYRLGIPAGTGVMTADKVGFLNGLLHDAAIVYGPKSTYVLVILSDGSLWSQLADAAKQVHTYLQE